MTTETDLPPLPEGEAIGWTQAWSYDQMRDYARANMEPLLAEVEALRAEVERLNRYYKNGIDCFVNPCERHSGERTPPFAEFFEKYGGQCLICVVDNNKALQAENERLAEALRDAATSMQTIADKAGRDEYLMTTDEVRGYANSRANAARAALSKENSND